MIRGALDWWCAALVVGESVGLGLLVEPIAGFLFAGVTLFGVMALNAAHDRRRDDDP